MFGEVILCSNCRLGQADCNGGRFVHFQWAVVTLQAVNIFFRLGQAMEF